MKKEDFPHWLRRQIKIRGIQHKEFARVLGVASNTVCRWNTDKNLPNAPMLYRICVSLLFIDSHQGSTRASLDQLRQEADSSCMVSACWTHWAPRIGELR